MSLFRSKLACFLALCSLAAYATPSADDALARAVALRHAGHLQQAIEQLRSLAIGDDAVSVAARGELGAALVQTRRYDEAEPLLRTAYEQSDGSARAWQAIELGNLAASRRQTAEALRHYQEARALAGRDTALALTARINAARLAERGGQPALLASISADAARVDDPAVRARLRLSIGSLAGRAGAGKLAWENLDEARALAAQTGHVRSEVAALDALAQLYEQEGRRADALRLSQHGIARARAAAEEPTDLLLRLEWRQGRLLAARGGNDEARAAYQRAVEHVESIRQDIPIEYEAGRSSFRDTLEPLYLGYIDLLLKRADDTSQTGERVSLLRKARGIGELVKQSELQDYLGERCTVDAAQSDAQVRTAPGTAVVYPIVLPDRIELLFESAAGISHQVTPMAAGELRRLVSEYGKFLRDDNEPPYLAHAQRLYDLLIRPFAGEIAAQQVHTLLIVPDGVLRLVPWATLHDGKQFLVEKYALVINSGLSLSSQAAEPNTAFSALLAGMAEPGPVIDKLGELRLTRLLQPTAARSLGKRRTTGVRQFSAAARAMTGSDPAHQRQLREKLALPGVKAEVEALSSLLPGVSLLDSGFTTARLHDELAKGEYRIAHVATHGYFGSTADESFIMAYDNVVTMDGLQKLLQLEGVRKTPIELLTLSACETAEGDDRSPLGIAGAALKARARSALGSLWPVSDEAAQRIMQSFYSGLVRDGLSKAEALRRAQMSLLGDANLQHPYYWAPFILVGNWR